MRGFHEIFIKILWKNHGENGRFEDKPADVFYDYAKPLFNKKIEKMHDECLFFSFSIFNVPF